MRKMLVAGTLALTFAATTAFSQTPSSQTPAQPPSSKSPTVQTPKGPDATTAKPPTDPAHRFVYNTYLNGLAEIELGKLAQQKASSNEVKQFGERLATDHAKANEELASLAQTKNITLPTSVEPKHKATYNRLEKLSGAAFDRAFMQEMVQAHRTAVNNFKQEASKGKDAEIKAWASKTLPTLEEHLKQAQSINTAVGTSGRAK